MYHGTGRDEEVRQRFVNAGKDEGLFLFSEEGIGEVLVLKYL